MIRSHLHYLGFLLLGVAFAVAGGQPARAASAQAEGSIQVTATVALSPDYAFALSKNSEVTVPQTVITAGEPLPVRVHCSGPFDQSLANHWLVVEVVQAEGKVVLSQTAVSGADGVAQVTLATTTLGTGTVTVRAVDLTYADQSTILLGNPVTIHLESPLSDRQKLVSGTALSGTTAPATISTLLPHSADGIMDVATYAQPVSSTNPREIPSDGRDLARDGPVGVVSPNVGRYRYQQRD